MSATLPPGMEVKNSITRKPTNVLLRRPRPPRARTPLPGLPSASRSTGEVAPVTGSTGVSSNAPLKGVTFSDEPMDKPSGPVPRTNGRHMSLPVKPEDLYRTDIEELIRQQELSSFVVHPVFPRGPEFFPPGKVLRADTLTTMTAADFLPDEIHLAKIPGFTFNDLQLAPIPKPPIQISQGAVSRQNYLKLTSWFATHMPVQESVNTVTMRVNCTPAVNRVPKRQILTELQAMINRILKDSLSGSHETSTTSSSSHSEWPPPGPNDTLFQSVTSGYFCGQARSSSPFDASHQPFISPSEVAILESMMSGGSHLSLKAHFVEQLPVLSPLSHTLTSLNLSFNSFKRFPPEILQLEALIFLSMRNNPLHQIPNEISVLQNLRFLCLSFCNLSQLPLGLFDLSSLVDLDISYNNLVSIPRQFCKLKNLSKLNIEGNRLPGLPATALSVPLSHIILGNNLMHPLLWAENTKNTPQTLVDTCCTIIRKSTQSLEDDQLSPEILKLVQRQSSEKCDECQERIFGEGLRVIRGVEHSHFKVRSLPFIFIVCSPTCSSLLRSKPAKFWLKT